MLNLKKKKNKKKELKDTEIVVTRGYEWGRRWAKWVKVVKR